MLIDIHSHLDHSHYKQDLDKVISNAKKAKVKIILTAGVDSETNRKTLELAQKYDIVKACLGFYPIQYESNNEKTTINDKSIKNKKIKDTPKNVKSLNNRSNIDEELKFIEKNKKNIAAIGEVGLDYYESKNNSKEQKELFKKVISLAEKINKPMIIHSRKAESDCIEMLQSSKLNKIIMHCFSGKKSLVKKIIDNGWFLTAPTCITRATQYQENVALTPITQLFCETDAPYLSPYRDTKNPEKFQRNEPAFILESYRKVAEIKGMELKEVVNNIWMNWQKVF